MFDWLEKNVIFDRVRKKSLTSKMFYFMVHPVVSTVCLQWVFNLCEVCSRHKNPDPRVIQYYDSANGKISQNVLFVRFREITFHGMSLKSQNTQKTQSLQRGSYRAVLWDLKLPQIYILCHLNKLDSSQFKYYFQICLLVGFKLNSDKK